MTRIDTLVTVLVPVRDEAPFLRDALDSLSAQTFGDFEAVVVDDGSTDGSAELAEAHARRDARFRVVRQEPRGVVAALQRAAAEARGAYLARLDGDDVALPDRLALQVEALESEGLVACGGRFAYVPGDTVTDGARRYERWLNSLVTPEAAARDVFVECPLPHPALTVLRDAFEAVGGYRERGWPEDYDLVLRLWAAGGRFRNVEQLVLHWRDHPGRLSRTDRRYAPDAFVRCKVHHLRGALLRGRRVVVWGAGPVGKSFGRALGDDLAAFVEVDPRKVGREIYGVPVVSVDDAPRFADAFALGAVAGEEAREQIRAMVAAQGRADGVDFVAVA